MFVSAAVVIFTFTAVGTVVSDTYRTGGVAVLAPGSSGSAPITTVTWKHGANIAVERYGQNTTAYRTFNGRCEVDTSTGALTISNLSVKDSGIYTPEINGRIMNTIEITVITAVPEPIIIKHCNPEETQCTLTCEASITDDMRTVTYSWEIGDRQGPSSSKEIHITQDDAELVGKAFSCNLTNLVSSERSEVIMSPFTNTSSGAVIIAVVAALIGLVALIALVFLAGYCIWRRKQTENTGFRHYCTWLGTNCGRAAQWTPERTQVPRAEADILLDDRTNVAETSAVAPNADETLKHPQQEDSGCDPVTATSAESELPLQ